MLHAWRDFWFISRRLLNWISLKNDLLEIFQWRKIWNSATELVARQV